MRETLIFQGILTLIGIALVVAGIGYLSTSVPLGVIGAVGGLLIIAGAVKMAVRKNDGNSNSQGLAAKTTVTKSAPVWGTLNGKGSGGVPQRLFVVTDQWDDRGGVLPRTVVFDDCGVGVDMPLRFQLLELLR